MRRSSLVGLLVLLVTAGCAPTATPSSAATPSSSETPVSPSASLRPSVGASASAIAAGELCNQDPALLCRLAAGHYDPSTFEPALSFDLGEGWRNTLALQSVIGLKGDLPDEFLEFATDAVAAVQGTQATPIEPTPAAFIAWLRSQSDLNVSTATDVTVGGVAGTQVDVTATVRRALYTSPGAPGIYELQPGQQVRFIVLEVNGHKFHIAAEAPAVSFDAFWADVSKIVDSVAFR